MSNKVMLYDPSLFVNREPEVQRVEKKIACLLERLPVSLPHTAFHGPRGSGKTWLLNYLRDRLAERFGNQITLLFSPLDPRDPHPAKSVLKSACSTLGVLLPAEVPLYEISLWLTNCCHEVGHPVVIIVDELDKVPLDILKEIELYYISPLFRHPNVLLILGSRIPAPGGRLGDVEFKLRVESRDLPPFDQTQTGEQLRRLGCNPALAPAILEAGGGYPISNAILAQQWATDPGRALEECAQALLEGVPKDLQQYFRVLCVPDTIEIERMPRLLAVYFSRDPSYWDTQLCRRILTDMVRTHLVRWEKWTPSRYGMDPAVRQVLLSALQRTTPPCGRNSRLAESRGGGCDEPLRNAGRICRRSGNR